MATLTNPMSTCLAVALTVHMAATTYVAVDGLMEWLHRRHPLRLSLAIWQGIVCVLAIVWSYVVVHQRIRQVRYRP